MRTALDRLHVPHHRSGWWVGHTVGAVVGALALLYAAAVLLLLLLKVVL